MTTVSETVAINTFQNELANTLANDKVGIVSILSYAKGKTVYDGSTDVFDALTRACEVLKDYGGTLLIPSTSNGSTYLLNTNFTFPDNVNVEFVNGGNIKVANGVVLTGVNTKITTGLSQIFDLSLGGTISGTWNIETVYPEWFGSDFKSACDFALAIDKYIYVTNDKSITLTSDIDIPSIYGNDTTLSIVGNYSLVFDSQTRFRDITFAHITPVNNASPILKSVNSSVSNIYIRNCFFKLDTLVLDGTELSATCISFTNGVSNLYVNNTKFNNVYNAIYVNGASSNLHFNKIDCFNYKIGIYLSGVDSHLNSDIWVDGVYMSDLCFKNTSEQYATFVAAGRIGKDSILFEHVRNVNIDGFYSEYPCERPLYCSYGKNITVKNVKMVNFWSGLKFVGFVSVTNSISNISDGFYVSNVESETSLSSDNYVYEFYNCKNIDVSNHVHEGHGTTDMFVSTSHSVQNLKMKNITANGLHRNFWIYYDVATTDHVDIPSIMSDIEFSDISCDLASTLYYAFQTKGNAEALATGTYKFTNFKINNFKVRKAGYYDNYDNTIDAVQSFKGIIFIDEINGLLIDKCKAIGYNNALEDGEYGNTRSALPFRIGSNTKSVTILHEQTLRFGLDRWLGMLHTSNTSKITLHISDRFGVSGTLEIKSNTNLTDTDLTQNLNDIFKLKGNYSVRTSANLNSAIFGSSAVGYSFPIAMFGKIDIVDNNGNRGYYDYKSNDSIVKRATSDVIYDVTGNLNKIWVYKTGNQIIAKSNIGATNIILDFELVCSAL